MNTLNFETGIVTFTVNDKAEVSFNPSDGTFVKRLYDAFDALDKKQRNYDEDVKKAANSVEIFDLASQLDKEMRALIDDIFQAPVADDIFGNMNVYAMASGLPVWCNFLFAVIDEIDATVAKEKTETNPRLAKYMAKYKKK